MTQAQLNTFTDVFRGFLLAKQAENVTRSMIDLYCSTRDYWIRRFGNIAVSEIAAQDVRTFLLWLQGRDESTKIEPPRGRKGKLAGSTIDIHFRNLRAFLFWCEDEEIIPRTPMRKVKKPKFDEVLPEALTEAEVVHLLDCVKSSGDRNAFRDYVIHLFLLDTGVRLAEVTGLTLDTVNLDEGYARVFGKGRRERIVPLGVELRRELSRYMLKYRRAANGERALFINEHGFRLEKRGIAALVGRDLRKYVARELTRRGPHTHRHTFATFNLRKTHDLKATSLILGHSTTRTTERYVHLVGEDVLRNAEGSPMDQLIRHGANGRDSSQSKRQLD